MDDNPMKKKRLAGLAGLTACAIVSGAPAVAQTIDYGTLEEMFGEPVTASATGKPQRAGEAPVTLEIISQDEIRRTGATNIPDVLQRVVGLDVWRFGAGQAEVAVRGANSTVSPRLLVLLNGRQVYLDHYGYTSWHDLPVTLAEIRQIEVVKGPNTALFGFNAVGGIVNIITYDPLKDSVSNVTVRGGTQDFREVSATANVKLGPKIGLQLSASGYNGDDFDKGFSAAELAQGRNVDQQRRMGRANARVQVTPDSQLDVELTASEYEQSLFNIGYSFLAASQELWSGKASYAVNTGLGLIEATIYQNNAEFTYNGVATINNGIVSPALVAENKVTVARIQDLFKLGAQHSVRIAAEYRRNELEQPSGPDFTVGYDVYSASAMWDWAVADGLSLVNAVRLDHLRLERNGMTTAASPYGNDDYDRTSSEFSFNSGLVWAVTGVDTVRLSAARGVQVPSLFQYGQNLNFGMSLRVGNPDIDPTIVTNYELAWDHGLSGIDGKLRTAVFHQTNRDMMAAARTSVNRAVTPPAIVQVPVNLGDTTISGLELSLEGRIGAAWSWKAGYAYQTVDDDFDLTQTEHNFEDSSPEHKLSAEIGYTAGAFEANLFGLYVSGTEMLRGATLVDISSYLYLAGRIGYHLTDDVTVALSAFNATRDDAQLTSGLKEERRVFGSISVDF